MRIPKILNLSKQYGEWGIKLNNRELLRLKNSIAMRDVIKILVFTVIAIYLLTIIIDGLYNDAIATDLDRFSPKLYRFCVANKTLVMFTLYITMSLIISFIVIRNSNHYMVEIVSVMDQILKEPEKEIQLSSNLIALQTRLNQLRLDLIANQRVAKEAETKKNDLIMYMAHDLKTPLTSTIGYLSLLTQEKEISKPLQEKYMKIALDKALRLEELTNQFFEITRYNLQDMPINKQKIDLSFLLEQLMDECYVMLKKKNLEYQVNKPEHLYFFGDGDKLARAFENLLKNAINYSYGNTAIEMDMKETEEKIEIKFRNKGDKIPEYKLDKLFEKFYRLDESRTSSTGGAGLGLAITKQIIERHGGTISVKNDDEYIEFDIEFTKAT